MDKNTKKIVRSELLCFLCGYTLTKERVWIFGKSSAGIQSVIKVAIDIDVTVFSSNELFICTLICHITSLFGLKNFRTI